MPLDLPILTVADAAAWRHWLAREYSTSKGVWLTLAKKNTSTAVPPTAITHAQALEEALCVGWIDAQSRSHDAVSWSQVFMPRAPRSIWSQRNVGLVAQLEASGRMTPAGRAAVDKAKADGRWDAAYARPVDAKLPDEMLAAIAAVPAAQATWEAMNKRNRWAVYFRVCSLKTQAGRERRMAAFVESMARGEMPYPQAVKGGKTPTAAAVSGAGKTTKVAVRRTTKVVKVATVRPEAAAGAKRARGAAGRPATSPTATTRVLRSRGGGKADG